MKARWLAFTTASALALGGAFAGCAQSEEAADPGSGVDARTEDAGDKREAAVHDSGPARRDAARPPVEDAGRPRREAGACTPMNFTFVDPNAVPDSGASTDGSSDADPEASTDAATDAAITSIDAGPNPPVCSPQSTTGLAPTWRPPAGLYQGVCTPSQMSDFFTACLDTAATPQACAKYRSGTQGDVACGHCLLTTEKDATYGAVIQKQGLVALNIAGCIAALEPCNDQCAKANQAETDCEDAACGAVCPVTDQSSFLQYNLCITQAQQGVCAKYNQNAQCQNQLMGSNHDAQVCLPGTATTFQQYYMQIAPVFCGN